MLYKEHEFYEKLLSLINEDLKSKSLKPIDLLKTDYIISRTQYYNIDKIAKGDKTISRLSNKRLINLCNYLNININELLFDVDFKTYK